MFKLWNHSAGNKKKLVYTATGNGQYLKIIGILAERGIPYTTRNNSVLRSSGFLQDQFIQYEIYVDEKDAKRAKSAIFSSI
ncbi:hypothetical protein D2962_14245 [Biomaibacter acetigenes]|jgi:hypothetical protein|uniref:DUF2007 domain-containing protein n=1 Tax=Biomaibacter acetigenes TaxID=2316383 RepID=A0A3G2R840_9FIRM|nr:hypothetical protein [Biomaibacter acetigenes]AYO31606.1 hypothetical protein D2962_14245 [Biomaibacter acetigenes]